ncbi:MAG TPA: sn-glycerol-3-phosphate ABC transporter ATP-binding protein UgpC [Candidatus Izemoplasmatales bacterium]|nr:sn-glycerol-3-phosphate ABC transporter ATP-binding protein UgpC [Bacillota bacterium]HRY77402.1 sn-glycerol-3-phosphate ABC transporter ATP-binding protein UgpC [Candidatus Izemoplasmatales bacterium]
MATLSFKHLDKIYDNGVQAVFDFTLEVAEKEFIVFVGPSGCGKSTTLRMVAGLEEITAGELYIDDRLVNDVAPKDRNIAMVFQSYALYPHMSVYDNMAFGLKLRKMPKDDIERRVKNAAEILGLVPFLDRKPKALSGGQRQRVALGRAIVRDAKVFLMDEPLSNLDAKLRVAMRAELIKLHERLNTTTIYVTHDQIEAMTMATRIVVMKDGHIQQIGAPKEIYDNPTNMFVGGFIGTPAMNFLNGVVQEDGYFYCENLKLRLPEPKFKLMKDKNYVDRPIVFGIRPEDIHDELIALETYKDSLGDLDVDVAELLGSETNIHISVGKTNIIAKVNARSDIHIGDKIKLAFNMNKCHFFDPENELRITKDSPVKVVTQ